MLLLSFYRWGKVRPRKEHAQSHIDNLRWSWDLSVAVSWGDMLIPVPGKKAALIRHGGLTKSRRFCHLTSAPCCRNPWAGKARLGPVPIKPPLAPLAPTWNKTESWASAPDSCLCSPSWPGNQGSRQRVFSKNPSPSSQESRQIPRRIWSP